MNSRTTKRALTKNKKWRKIDNTSVDRMTIEKTQEVLEGDVATKSDDQLFVIDTVVNKKPSLSNKKDKWQNHQLSWEKRIQPNENTVGLKRATPPDLQRRKQQKIREIKKKVDLQQKKPQAPVEDLVYDLKGNPLQVPSDQNGLFDIWNTADSRVVAVQKLKRKNPSVNTDYLEPILPPPSKKRKIEAPSKLPAVDTGTGGASYRPVYEDHQELLAEAVAEVIKQREEEKRVNNILKSKQKYRKTEIWVDGERDVPEEEEEKEIEAEKEEEEDKNQLAQPFVERKSRAERNKEMRKKEMKKIQIRREELEKQRKDFEELPNILEDIHEQEEARKERGKYKAKIKENADYKTKKLGPIPFVADPTAVVLTADLPSKLRQVQPKVDLLRDRYLSLQKRNIIEPRIKRFKTRRYPIQVVEKWSASK
jgi:nucleolar protein 53